MREQIHPEQSNQIRKRPAELRSKLEETGDQHCNQCCPNLALHGIGAGSHKRLDFEVLLQCLKKNFHLPTVFIDGGNRGGSQVEVVGQKNRDLLLLRVLDFDPSQRVGTFLDGPETSQLNEFVLEHMAVLRNFSFSDNLIKSIVLHPGDWDTVIITGVSERPVYLYINDSNISINDASSLWGKSVRETTRELYRQLGSRGFDVAIIGQAGENLVRYANIMVSTYRAAGRGGLGAVMGSKRLKAIAVRGSGSTMVEDQQALNTEIEAVLKKIQHSKKAELYLKYGTAAAIEYSNESWTLPVNNFQKSHLESGHKLGGTYLVANGYMRNGGACSACPIGCDKFSTVKSGKYRGYSGGPEYETLAALGAGCGITGIEAVLKGNEL